MNKILCFIGLWLIACVCIAQVTPLPSEDTVEVEITGGLVMTLNFSRVNTTTHDTLSTIDPLTDRLLNEMLEALSTGHFDEVGMIAFIHKWDWVYSSPPDWRWDTTYLLAYYDGGAYDTCNWVRWRSGYRCPANRLDTIRYFYLLPGVIDGTPLSEAYATEIDNLGMGFGDSLAVTWTYVQSARPE